MLERGSMSREGALSQVQKGGSDPAGESYTDEASVGVFVDW